LGLIVVRPREREGDAEVVEQVHERRLARLRQLGLVEAQKDFRERTGVVEGAVRAADVDAVRAGEVLQAPAGGDELTREGQRVEGAEPFERTGETLQNP